MSEKVAYPALMALTGAPVVPWVGKTFEPIGIANAATNAVRKSVLSAALLAQLFGQLLAQLAAVELA